MRDHSDLDELVRRTARVHDERLLAERDRDAEEELTRQIMSLPRERTASGRAAARRGRSALQPALAGLATIAVIAVAVVMGGPGGSPPAIADWTAEASPLSDAERDAFETFCREDGQGEGPDDVAPILSADDQLVIADKRGRITYGLFVAPDGRLSDCNHWEGVPGSRTLGGGGVGTSYGAVPPLQRPVDVAGSRPRFEAPGQAAAEAMYGRISPEVDQVLLHLDDGRSVTASLNEGHFLGWWPINCSGSRFDRQCSPRVVEVEASDSEGGVLDRWVLRDPDGDLEFVPAEEAVRTP